jgi:hypothetical protein
MLKRHGKPPDGLKGENYHHHTTRPEYAENRFISHIRTSSFIFTENRTDKITLKHTLKNAETLEK